jgi:hypothetical protein
MVTTRSFEMPVTICQIVWRHVTEKSLFSMTFSHLQKFSTDELEAFDYSLFATSIFISEVAICIFFYFKHIKYSPRL